MRKIKVKNLIITTTLLNFIITMFNTNTFYAQDLGADLVSSYVWRGTQFGSGPHIQPWVSLSKGDLELGAWGKFSNNC